MVMAWKWYYWGLLAIFVISVLAVVLGVLQDSNKINTSLSVGGCFEGVCMPGDVTLAYNITNNGSVKIDRIKLSSKNSDKYSLSKNEIGVSIAPNSSGITEVTAEIPLDAVEGYNPFGTDIYFEFEVEYYNGLELIETDTIKSNNVWKIDKPHVQVDLFDDGKRQNKNFLKVTNNAPRTVSNLTLVVCTSDEVRISGSIEKNDIRLADEATHCTSTETRNEYVVNFTRGKSSDTEIIAFQVEGKTTDQPRLIETYLYYVTNKGDLLELDKDPIRLRFYYDS